MTMLGAATKWLSVDWNRNVRRDEILAARAVEDLAALAPRLRGFNRQILRAALVVRLAEKLAPTAFVETGTFLGETAIAARDLLAVPVHTVEVSAANYFKALSIRLRTGRVAGIRQYLGNSADVLRRLTSGGALGPRPFFYLDAHWGDYCPLADEFAVILGSLPWAVVVVDDFEVRGRPGFGFDRYRDAPIGLELIKPVVGPETRLFLPDHDPETESGHRRGTLLLTHGVDVPADPAAWGLPFPLYRECRAFGPA